MWQYFSDSVRWYTSSAAARDCDFCGSGRETVFKLIGPMAPRHLPASSATTQTELRARRSSSQINRLAV
jgi:hypothetical protein